ncbi:hypothetical protein [Serratia fonticola]|uniref:hypothetical protein n=1 Tax=Serratia fonticola TaxID=47917 RepID=UPI00301D948D
MEKLMYFKRVAEQAAGLDRNEQWSFASQQWGKVAACAKMELTVIGENPVLNIVVARASYDTTHHVGHFLQDLVC